MTGTGTQPVQHSVSLSWDASTSPEVGYNVYRSTQSGGPYTKLNSSVLITLAYTDSSVQSGSTYFYAATAVDSNNVESAYSNIATAVIP
jgi:fibronectin type 3 domain-containing protein